MKNASNVLLLSFDSTKLKRRESALRAMGFEVKTVHSPGQARFEIEMGMCGIFVTCFLIPDIVNQDLMNLFRRYCGDDGLIIFVAEDQERSCAPYEPRADVRIPESRDPDGIVEALKERARLPNRRAS